MPQPYRHAGLAHQAATVTRRAAGPRAVRREFAAITRAAGLGRSGLPGAAALVRVHPQRQRRPRRGLSDLAGCSGTSVTRAVYWHEIGLVLAEGAAAGLVRRSLWLGARGPARSGPPGPVS